MSQSSNRRPDLVTHSYGLDISSGYRYPEMWNYNLAGHKESLGSGAGAGKTIQNDSATALLFPVFPAAQASIVSDNAADAFGGLGTQLIIVIGVDSNGHYRNEIIQTNGTTPVLTVNSYFMIDNAVVLLEGSSGQQGNIQISISGTVQGAIIPEFLALLSAHVLVPSNYTLYLTQQSESATSNVEIRAFLIFDVFNGGTVASLANAFWASFGTNDLRFDHAPIPLPSGTYARFDAIGGTGDGATVAADGTMVHNDLVKDFRGHILSAPPGTVYDTINLPTS